MEHLSIQKLDQATKMLTEVHSIDDAKELIDLAEAARVYAKQVDLGLEAQNHAAEIKIRAQWQAGKLLQQMDKNTGAMGNPGGQGAKIVRLQAERAQPTYKDIGINYRDAHQWQTIASLPEEELIQRLEETKASGKEITTAGVYRDAKREEYYKTIDIEPDAEAVIKLHEYNFDVRPGQVWKLGSHRVMCGDAYNQDHVKILMDNNIPDALITDPPYGIDYKPDWKKYNGADSDYRKIEGDDKPFNPKPFLDYSIVVLFGANYFSNQLPLGGWICWDKRLDINTDRMFGSPFELAWFKTNKTNRKAIMIRVLHGGVINTDSLVGVSEKRFHPTQKPISVMTNVLKSVTSENQIIYDPFSGVGTTLLACEKTGRRCLSMEIDKDYVTYILARWVKLYGTQPQIAGDV